MVVEGFDFYTLGAVETEPWTRVAQGSMWPIFFGLAQQGVVQG